MINEMYFYKNHSENGARFPNIFPIPAKKSFRSHTQPKIPPSNCLLATLGGGSDDGSLNLKS